MKKIKAIIFDMDGTIIDTETIWKDATQRLVESKGVLYTPELEKELNNQLRGLALNKSCNVIKEMFKLEDELEDLIKEKAKLANDMYEKGIKYIQGFHEFHGKVLAHDLHTAIATNATPCTVEVSKRILGLEKYFGQHIYDISKVNYVCKPDPAIYLHVAEQFNLDPSECIAIEDSAHGATAAKAAGMICIGINTANDRDQLHMTDFIIDEYHEIELPALIYHKFDEKKKDDEKKPVHVV